MLEDADGLLRFASLTARRPVPHGFASATAFGQFDARSSADLDRLQAALLPSSKRIITRQSHTANVETVDSASSIGDDVDGLVTATPDLLLVAYSADCPILILADRSAVGVFHCGWRGIARGMVASAVEAMVGLGAEREGLFAAITPGAARCCYEVGDEVFEGLSAVRVDRLSVENPYRTGATSTIDLAKAIELLLVREGVTEHPIEAAPHCTICGGERFHSYRRSGAGVAHMATAIGIEPPEALPRGFR